MNRKRTILTILAGFLIFSVLLAACSLPAGTEEPDQDAIETAAAQTLAANQTATAVAEVNQEATQVAQTQTAIAEMPTETPEPTPTFTSTPTEIPTHTPTPEESNQEICNWAGFIDDVTVEDRTLMDENETFTKIWRLENIGDCVWTTDYQVIFHSGYQMGAPDALELPEVVQPGETVDITMEMTAPDQPGTYTGYWILQDDDGNIFGVGADTDSPFWVRIRVTEEEEYIVYDMAYDYCDAGWESNVVEDLQCPSKENFTEGFVQDVENPQLENGAIDNELAILTYPADGESGYIVGRFPGIEIEDGDHFRATISCQYGAEDCDVRYTLRVAVDGEGLDLLGQWREDYEGLYYPVDVDLSDYAGMEVDLILSVIATDDTGENYALWLRPRVVREAD
jgi:hypothetical protein